MDPETPVIYVTASRAPISFSPFTEPKNPVMALAPPPEATTATVGTWTTTIRRTGVMFTDRAGAEEQWEEYFIKVIKAVVVY